MGECLEKLWNMDITLPAFKALSESTSNRSGSINKEQTVQKYGDSYIHLDFEPPELTISEVLFNRDIYGTLDIVRVDKCSTRENIKLNNESGTQTFVMEFLKKGGYGKIYMCTEPKALVCKKMCSSDVGKQEFENGLISEAFIHSILSCDKRAKKLCSRFHSIKLEPVVFGSPLLFSEMMDGVLNNVSKPSPKIFNSVMVQMAEALMYLQEKYKFIHGDLKINNICYRKTGIRKYKFVLIDFGMSVLSYKGVEISTNVFMKRGALPSVLFPNSGDLSLLLTSLYTPFREKRETIANLLIFPGETQSIVDKFSLNNTSREVYCICYGCHNPQTTPENIIKFIKADKNPC